MPEEQAEIKIDQYLESPKAFHLEMPLYHELDLTIGVVAEKAYELIAHSGTMDAYCIWCDKESVFDSREYVGHNYDSTYSS